MLIHQCDKFILVKLWQQKNGFNEKILNRSSEVVNYYNIKALFFMLLSRYCHVKWLQDFHIQRIYVILVAGTYTIFPNNPIPIILTSVLKS